MNLRERIEYISLIPSKDVYSEKLTDDQKKVIELTYNEIGQKFIKKNCNDCYERAYIYIVKNKINFINQLNQTKMGKSNSKFVLRGRRLAMHGVSDIITSANCTDEKCLAILKKNPAAIKFFSVYPENWRELAESFDVVGNARIKKDVLKPVVVSEEEIKENEQEISEKLSAEKKATLEAKTKAELQDFAKSLELDEAEYIELNKAKLVEYLLEKTK